MKTGTWVDKPSNQAHQTTVGLAKGSEVHDEAIPAATPAAQGGPVGGQVSIGCEERLRGPAAETFLGFFSTHSTIRNGCFFIDFWEIPRKNKTQVAPTLRNP